MSYVSEVLPWGFSSRRMKTLVFTKAMRYLHLCFMTLILPRIASFIARTLLSLANRCEPLSYGSPSCITNIILNNVILLCKGVLTDFDYIVRVRIVQVCLLGFIEIGFLGIAFVFIILCIGFLRAFCKWKKGIEGSDFYIAINVFQKGFVALILSIGVSFVADWVFIWGWVFFCPLSVKVLPFGNLLRRNLRRGDGSLGLVFPKS